MTVYVLQVISEITCISCGSCTHIQSELFFFFLNNPANHGIYVIQATAE